MTVSQCQDLLDADGNNVFEKALDEADAETKDLKKRYEMFAEAETMLLDPCSPDPLLHLRRRL